MAPVETVWRVGLWPAVAFPKEPTSVPLANKEAALNSVSTAETALGLLETALPRRRHIWRACHHWRGMRSNPIFPGQLATNLTAEISVLVMQFWGLARLRRARAARELSSAQSYKMEHHAHSPVVDCLFAIPLGLPVR
jgi:hypothetical protein